MTSIERRNYQIAVIVSIAFHGILIFIFFLKSMEPKPITLETYPVGMVELAQNTGSLRTQPAVITGISSDNRKNPNKGETKPSQPKKSQPEKPSSEIPLQNKKMQEGTHGVKSQVTEPSGDKEPDKPGVVKSKDTQGKPVGSDGNDTKGPTVDEPISFGSGEGMVSRLGPPPPYPKNAMNEGKEGEVAVRILVHANGDLEKVLLRKSSGDARLDKTTINTITRDWQFKPVSKDYYIDLAFIFNLQSGVTFRFIKSETGK
jgi:TonB family protein